MKILIVSDIHGTSRGREVAFRNIAIHKPDLVLVTGDITQFGPPSDARTFLNELGTKVRTLAMPGNCDPWEVVRAIEASRAGNLHAQRLTIEGLTFVGFGGSNPTPFKTIFELPEEEIFKALDSLMERTKSDRTILVTHCPPRGFRDLVVGRGNMDSDAIAQVVEKYKPRMVISGHIHEAYGVEEIGANTTIINPGAAKEGRAAIIDITPQLSNDGKMIANLEINIQLIKV